MIINKIIITDFGVYGGINEFDFRTSPEKTVILCGGKNGAGKTTLFESIMLCFYGKDFDDSGREKDYEEKILRSFHRNLVTNTTSEISSITIEFEIAFDGKIQEYQITRTWQNNDGKIDENLSIKKSNSKSNEFEELDMSIPTVQNRFTDARFENLDSIEKSEWQQFIDQLIPRGIAKLFFFDGEKIQSIADDDNENKYIQSSFDTLLGLDIVNQLQKDIGLMLYRNKKKTNKEKIDSQKGSKSFARQNLRDELISSKDFEGLVKFYIGKKDMMLLQEFSGDDLEPLLLTQTYLEKDINKKEKDLEEFDNSIKSIHKEFMLVTEKFQKIGGKYYEKNEEMEKNEENMVGKITVTEKEIQDLCSTVLPFCLIPKELEEIKSQLESDQKIIQQNYEKNVLAKNNEKISSLLNSESFLPDISIDIKQSIGSELTKILKNELKTIETNKNLFFDLSESNMEQFLNMIKNAKRSTVNQIQKLTNSYKIQKNALEKFQLVSKIRPEIDEIQSIMTERDRLQEEKGKLKNQHDILESELYQKKTQLKMLNAKIRLSLSKKKDSEKLSSSEKMANSVLSVLDEYSQSLREKKISLLEENVLKGLQILLHKKDFVRNVTIDRETFEVKLYDVNNDEITKNMLSKGELQIYATALVWSLAKTSGRPLPFMIDTPLARLDKEHREKLVESFFPRTSQQTIILSTDSEINLEYYKKLEPFISKSFVIEYDPSKGKTSIIDGYFFNKKGEVTVEVL